MTASKPNPRTSNQSLKVTPKRAVSFCDTCKFDAPSKSQQQGANISDTGLQCSNKRRRYMRRGSKSPSMLMVLNSINLENELTVEPREEIEPYHQKAQRRLSIVSALRLRLEKSNLMEPKVARTFRRMSIDQTLELLTNV